MASSCIRSVRNPGGYSEDDLFYLLDEHFYLLDHFVVEQVGDDELYGDDGAHGGQAEGVLRELGISAPQDVLYAMSRVTVGSLDFDIVELDEALQTIYDPPVSAP